MTGWDKHTRQAPGNDIVNDVVISGENQHQRRESDRLGRMNRKSIYIYLLDKKNCTPKNGQNSGEMRQLNQLFYHLVFPLLGG